MNVYSEVAFNQPLQSFSPSEPKPNLTLEVLNPLYDVTPTCEYHGSRYRSRYDTSHQHQLNTPCLGQNKHVVHTVG